MILTVVLLVILADIFSKYLVVQLIPLNTSVHIIPKVLDFTYARNEGAAFGMLSSQRWIFMTASVVFIVLLIYFLKKSYTDNKLYNISLSMILGGGIANMLDRVILGYVVDFIEVTFVDFAIFNIADSCITIGMALFIVYLVFFDTIFFPPKNKEVKKDAYRNS